MRMLRTALGPAITGWLDDSTIVKIMLNPDGRLWIDRLTGGLSDTRTRLSGQDGERIVHLVAHHVAAGMHPGSLRLSAELPETGERFEGLIPPIVAAPALAIRKPAVAIFTLADYARAGIMTTEQDLLCDAVSQRRNILIAGGTSTGKTTLFNALLAEVAWTADRVVLIEDTRELQCNAPNLVALRTRDGVASLCDLVRPFWPIKIGTIDIDALQHDRDQLFAEAYALFQAGVQWWPYQGFERRHIMPQQSDRYEGDPWEEQIRSYLNTLLEPQTTVTEIARAIGIDAPKVGKAEQNRITATMQDLGWKRGKRNGPKGTRWWVRG